MQMDEDHGEDRSNGRDDHQGRGEKIGIGGGDDAVTRIQLAARWSESFAPEEGDSLVGTLKRFRVAYEYLDAVIHGVEPQDPDESESRTGHPTTAPYSPPSPPPSPPSSEPERQGESRPW